MMNRAVFFDRDGVINDNDGHYYVFRPDQLAINPGIKEAIARLKAAGFYVIVISNQGGVSRGLYEKADVDYIHRIIDSEIRNSGGQIDQFYYCPHHDKLEKCLCRKPGTLMLEKAIAVFDIDVQNSYLIGDSVRDIEAGERMGLNCFKIASNSSVLPVIDELLK